VAEFVLSGTADLSNQTVFGEMWFTSANGIYRYSGAINETGTWHYYSTINTPNLPSDQVWTSATKPDDFSIWFGGQSGGAVSVSFGLSGDLVWSKYPLPSDSKINSIAFDLHNTVWLGTQNGGASFNLSNPHWTLYDSASSGPGLGNE